jgi:hypothetical protein
MKALLLLTLGLLLVTLNELLKRQTGERVVTRYLPRDLDAWFKDPENQPSYVYTNMFNEENVRVL